jgi:Rrf2 family nitric oxide-sensitive transcriptional repressor
MRLTQWSDYSLRVLMYCAHAEGREAPVTITEIAQAHNISRNHLTKVVTMLAGSGLLKTTRGRGGGLQLLKPAGEIVIGDVVRKTENDLALVECFGEHNSCRLDQGCRLKAVLNRALKKFMAELDGVTLADIVGQGAQRIGIPQPIRIMPRVAPRKG